MGRTLAGVEAHPDDDAYGVAALVALHTQDPGFRFVLVHATDGEAGDIAEGSGATRATLAEIRREEDRRAWRTLGRSPDGMSGSAIQTGHCPTFRTTIWSSGSQPSSSKSDPMSS